MIKVLKAGFYSTIQDKGRFGFASFGVPFSGVMDAYSADLANSILNNPVTNAVLEITFGGCVFKFLNTTTICISGADFSPKLNDKPILLNSKIRVQKDDVLSFGKINFGVRCYLAISGGIDSPIVLNSRSQFKNVTFSFKINDGDILPIKQQPKEFFSSKSSIKIRKAHFSSEILECYVGPEFDWLSTTQKEKLFTDIFTISKNNNRMGYQLNEILNNKLPQLLTSSVLPGTVQLTPSGKLILLTRDCQITGGYPRILQLSENSINRLSQKTTNNVIKFTLKSHLS